MFCLVIVIWSPMPCCSPQSANYFKEGNPRRLWGATGMARKWCTFSQASKGAAPVIVQIDRGWRQGREDWTMTLMTWPVSTDGPLNFAPSLLALLSFRRIWWSLFVYFTWQRQLRSSPKFQSLFWESCSIHWCKNCDWWHLPFKITLLRAVNYKTTNPVPYFVLIL